MLVAKGKIKGRKMSRQIYKCPKHEEFEVVVAAKDKVEESLFCSIIMEASQERCFARSYWVPSVPNFIGGPTTGAKKE